MIQASSGRNLVKLAVRPAAPAVEVDDTRRRSSHDEGSREQDETPRPLPQGVFSDTQSAGSEAYAPVMLVDPAATPKEPSRTGERRAPADPGPSASVWQRPATKPVPAPAPAASRPTWGELVFAKNPVPLDESIRKASKADTLSGPRKGPKGEPIPAGASGTTVLAAQPRSLEVFCHFDPVERTLKDFQLPDAQGRMVAFHDLDADLVLLDFWGTWCAPCRKSIPHLNDIQKMLGGKKIQVIGIACERTPAKDRAAKVAKTRA